MADIKLKIVNQALTRVGETTVTSLTGVGVLTVAALENWDDIVEDLIENGAWKFSSKTDDATLLTAQADAPLKYRWQAPADCVKIEAVLYAGQVLMGDAFDIQERIVRTLYNTDISLKYAFVAPLEEWPSRFRRLVTQSLEALFLRVMERADEAVQRDEDLEYRTRRAKHSESTQRSNRSLGDGSIVNRRRGVIGRRN